MSSGLAPENVLKPRFVGMMLSVCLSGAVLACAVIYFYRYAGRRTNSTLVRNKDPYWLQGLTTFVMVFVFIQCVSNFCTIYWAHVENFGDPTTIFAIPDSQLVGTLAINMVIPTVQYFFASRCWLLLGRPWWFIVLTAPLIVFGYASGIAVFVVAYQLTHTDNANVIAFVGSRLQSLGISNFVVAAGLDVIVTVCLTAKLRSWIKDVSSLPSANIVLRILMIGVNTCIVTTAAEITAAIFSAVNTTTNLYKYQYTYQILPQVYALNLLLQLLARPYSHEDPSSSPSRSRMHTGVVSFKLGQAHSNYAEATSVVLQDMDRGEPEPKRFGTGSAEKIDF